LCIEVTIISTRLNITLNTSHFRDDILTVTNNQPSPAIT